MNGIKNDLCDMFTESLELILLRNKCSSGYSIFYEHHYAECIDDVTFSIVINLIYFLRL